MVKARSAPEERQSELYLHIIRVHYYLLPMLFVMYNNVGISLGNKADAISKNNILQRKGRLSPPLLLVKPH